jgi:hypothetical protein
MSKHTSYSSRQELKPRQAEIHPVWRGIGFILILLVPILSYAGALVLIDQNGKYGWIPITRDMLSPIIEPMFYVKLGLTLFLVFLLGAVISLISFMFYRMIAPPRYGPLDVPPTQYKGKRYKR